LQAILAASQALYDTLDHSAAAHAAALMTVLSFAGCCGIVADRAASGIYG
jgi:hypothetical protein